MRVSHIGTSKLNILLKSGNFQVKMSQSEEGPPNGQIATAYKYSDDSFRVDFNVIRSVQLQGLTLCGSATSGPQS